MRLAPHTVFTWMLALFALCAVGTVWLTTRTPWLGLGLQADVGGLRVVSVAPSGPAAGVLKVGDRVVGLGSGTERIPLTARLLLRDPNALARYSELRELTDELSAVHRVLMQDSVALALADGRTVEIRPHRSAPWLSLPWTFWHQLAWTAVSFLIAASVWAFRLNSPTVRYFALSGAALMLVSLSGAVYSSRSLGMDGAFLEKLLILNHFFVFLFLASLVNLCWVYPKPLNGYGFAAPGLFIFAGLWWMADALQLWPSLDWAYRGAQFLAFLGGALLLAVQWLKRGQRLEDRRAMRWFTATALGGFGAFLILYPGALLATGQPWLEAHLAAVFLQLIYLGVAIGIYRYGLFQIDRWVLNGWLLFGLSAGLLLLDMLVASLFDARTSQLTAMSLVILAWLYFPLRQWLWARLSHRLERRDYRRMFSGLMKELLTAEARRPADEIWFGILERVFAPLNLRPSQTGPEQPCLREGGAEMHVPGAAGSPAAVLSYADRGSRLFSVRDERLAGQLLQLVNRAADFKNAAAQGALRERRRLAADLHDQVVPPLLSFIYRAGDTETAEAGRAAIRELRGIIQFLNRPEPPHTGTSAR